MGYPVRLPHDVLYFLGVKLCCPRGGQLENCIWGRLQDVGDPTESAQRLLKVFAQCVCSGISGPSHVTRLLVMLPNFKNFQKHTLRPSAENDDTPFDRAQQSMTNREKTLQNHL